MCTLTMAPVAGGLVVTMNRDEDKLRPEDPPAEQPLPGAERCWYPIDRPSGGTWLGVNGGGLIAALLNRYQEQNPRACRSRGQLVPAALAAGGLAAIHELAHDIPWEHYAPCDLVILHDDQCHTYSWNGRRCEHLVGPATAPRMLTSSSVDLEATCSWRHKAFDGFLTSATVNADSLFGFHRTPCRATPSRGVFMSRPGRHTKSISQILLSGEVIRGRYYTHADLDTPPPTDDWDFTWHSSPR